MPVRLLAVTLALVACSSPSKPVTTSPPSNLASPSDADESKLGNHGAVCQLGRRHENTAGAPKVVECSEGLSCCYPCGIQGCDFKCMTPAECNVKRP